MAKKKIDKIKNSSASEKVNSVQKNPSFQIPDLGKNFFWTFFGVLTFIAFIIYKDFLFLEKTFLFKDIGSDTVNTFYPIIIQNSQIWQNDGYQAWSFNSGMGQNISGFFFHEPFEALLYGKTPEGIALGMGWLQFLKVIGTGLLFFLYFRKMKLSDISSAIGSILLTFSGFVILGGCWCIFSFEIFTLALLLLSIENIISNKNYFLFAIGILLIGISQPFNLYVYGVFLLVYTTFRLYVLEYKTKDVVRVFGGMILMGVLGLAMSSFFLFAEIFQILESPRGSGENSYADVLSKAPVFSTADKTQNATSALRFFSSDMLGTGNEFKGWSNYLEAPLFYVGIFSLVLFPQVFSFLKKRQKIAYSVFLALWLLPVIFPFFRQAFWLFAGDYYRAFSFFVAFPLAYFSVYAIEHLFTGGKLNMLLHFIWTAILLFIVSISYTSVAVNSGLSGVVKIIIVAQALFVFLLANKNYKQVGFYGLLVLIVFEAIYFSNITVNNRPTVSANELKMKVGYNDYSVEAINYLKQTDKDFYRVDKTYMSGPAMHGSLNDGIVQGYHGTTSYNSFNNVNYVRFMQTTGVIKVGNELESRWVPGLAQRPILQSICNVKYILHKGTINPGMLASNDSIGIFNDVRVLKNKFALPLGFAYEKYIALSEFKKLKQPLNDITLLKAVIIDDRDINKFTSLSPYNLKDTTSQYSWDAYANDVKQLSTSSLKLTKHSNMLLSGTISLDKPKILFFSIPLDKGWHAKVNGTEQEILMVDNGLMGLMLNKGTHTIELNYEQRLSGMGKTLSLVSSFAFLALVTFTIAKRRKTGAAVEEETV